MKPNLGEIEENCQSHMVSGGAGVLAEMGLTWEQGQLLAQEGWGCPRLPFTEAVAQTKRWEGEHRGQVGPIAKFIF